MKIIDKEDRFEIIVRDKKTKETKLAATVSDDFHDPIDEKDFKADINDIVEGIQNTIDSGALFGL